MLAQHGPLTALLDALGVGVAVLNRQRQILFANRALLETFPAGSTEDLLGQRFGEAVGCIHAWDSPGGCGTGTSCET